MASAGIRFWDPWGRAGAVGRNSRCYENKSALQHCLGATAVTQVNRSDFQQLAELHLQHAKALLDAHLYSGAYYMCGYVVECALKACICKQTNLFDFYPHPKDAQKAWSHNFENLIEASGLEEEFEEARQAAPALDIKWKEVDDWSESSRYELRSQQKAEDLFAAVSDPDQGVLACIKRFW